jgi:hypothetical protein
MKIEWDTETTQIFIIELHPWCHGKRANLECSRFIGSSPIGRIKPKIIQLVFTAYLATLRNTSKDGVTRNEDNVTECSDTSIWELSFQ